MVLVLHHIRSLHNVGSIFRTADAAGVSKLYLCGITPAPVDVFGKPRQPLAKVSLGAEKSVAWEKARATATIIKKLRKEGYKIFAVEQSKSSTPYTRAPRRPLSKIALVLGAEVRGLPERVLARCDKILEIPMYGRKESLNVAVAAGVMMFELRRDRKIHFPVAGAGDFV